MDILVFSCPLFLPFAFVNPLHHFEGWILVQKFRRTSASKVGSKNRTPSKVPKDRFLNKVPKQSYEKQVPEQGPTEQV